MISDRIVMGTSIAPFDLEKQKKCIKSWIENGIKVISFNSSEELQIIQESFADIDVELYEIHRDTYMINGKRLPFIQDILDITANYSDHVCGYFNSDILIENFDEGLFKYICDECTGSLIVIHRNEISTYDDIKDLNWDIHFDGIDAFFIDKNIEKGLLGDWAYVQTIWDILLFNLCKIKSINLKTLLNPIAFHVRHKIRWNYEKIKTSCELFAREYYDIRENYLKKIFLDRYEIMFSYSKDIAYSKRDKKILFLLSGNNDEIEKSVEVQNLIESNTSCSMKSDKEYDIVVGLSDKCRLRETFLDELIFLCDNYDYCFSLGGFYVSEINGRKAYNQLNKSLVHLRNINANKELRIDIKRNDVLSNQIKYIDYPIFYNIVPSEILVEVDPPENIYIMPAGYSGNEWVSVNSCDLPYIKGFIDNDLRKQGKYQNGLPIISLDDVLDEENTMIIVCSKYYQEEIINELKWKRRNTIINSDDVVIVKNKTFYVFDIDQY